MSRRLSGRSAATCCGKDLSESILPGLVDIPSAYGNQMKDYQHKGMSITDEEIEQITRL